MTIRLMSSLAAVVVLSACKTLSGTYCTAPDLTAWCYTFEKKNKFRYDFGSCLGGEYGTGTYRISSDTIVFNFVKTEVARGSFNVELTEKSEDKISLKLAVIDSISKKPIVFYAAALYENGVLLGGTEGDIRGEASLIRPFIGHSMVLKIEYFEQYPMAIKLDEPGVYSITAEMASGAPNIVPSQEWVFRIEKIGKNEVLLGNFENGKLQSPLKRKKPKK